MSTTIKPLNNKVLVKRSKAAEKIGGILLPESAKEKPKEGIVQAVGPGKTNDQGTLETMTLKTGDRVLFGAYAGTEVETTTNEEHLILAEDEVLGVLS